jgi:NAD(P)-dependent dehydrogenase (short-subunit alcohol dehydrogenase family)
MAEDATPTQPNDRVWLITGCSTGFGREIAKLALARGERVAVTARDPSRVQDIVALDAARAIALELDVTDPAQVSAAVSAAEQRFGAIDVLVNNAGQGFVTSIEEAAEREVRELFEVNFFGLLAMTRAVLPGMRARRRGFIVNITSIGGLVGRAGSGYYAATKFAVEGLGEALAQEVGPLGIRVMLVEPGGFRTQFVASIKRHELAHPDYVDIVGPRAQRILAGHGRQPGDPAKAAAAIVQAMDAPNPPLHLVLGSLGWQTVQEKMEALQRDMEAWKDVAAGTDG